LGHSKAAFEKTLFAYPHAQNRNAETAIAAKNLAWLRNKISSVTFLIGHTGGRSTEMRRLAHYLFRSDEFVKAFAAGLRAEFADAASAPSSGILGGAHARIGGWRPDAASVYFLRRLTSPWKFEIRSESSRLHASVIQR
jgi:hypothetical protein